MPARRAGARVLLGAGLFLTTCSALFAQSLPGPVYHSLLDQGAERIAERIDDQFQPGSRPDAGDIEDLIEDWGAATGGPDDDWDWLAATRLWLRAGEASEASKALEKIGPEVPEALRRLENARVGFLENRAAAAEDWWASCAVATEESALEAWLDLVPLATPGELEAWNRFRTLPVAQRDDCAFFRRFLNRRAMASGRSVNERLAIHYARLRLARDRFGRRGKESRSGPIREGLPRSPGFDDRGMLYLRLGEPDRTTSYQAGECYEPNVTWAYEDPAGIRLYHLSPLGGTDNWWLLENLAEVFRCPVDPVSGRIIRNRNPMVAVSPILPLIPPWLLSELYASRAVLDPEYARLAHRFGGTATVEQLEIEREMTNEDALLAIRGIPERPDVDLRLRFHREWLQFRSPRPGTTRVWVNAELPAAAIYGAMTGSESPIIEIVVSVLEQGGDRLHTVPSSFRPDLPASAGEEGVIGIRAPLELRPGSYEALLVIRIQRDDGEETPTGNFVSDTLVVRDFGGTLPLLSDVAVAPDSGGAWQPRAGVRLRPSPSHRSGPDRSAWIFFEAYNLTPGGEFVASVLLENLAGDSGAPEFEQEYFGTATPGARIVTPILLRLDLGQTPPGEYGLRVRVTDSATGARTLDARSTLEVLEGD